MARDRSTIEHNKEKVETELNHRIITLKGQKVGEKAYKKDPIYRKLKSKVKKCNHQLKSIEKIKSSRIPGGADLATFTPSKGAPAKKPKAAAE